MIKKAAFIGLLLCLWTTHAWALNPTSTITGPKNGETFGTSIAKYEDTLAIGAPAANNFEGLVYLYTKQNNTWQPNGTIKPVNGPNATCGRQVALSKDYLVISCPINNRVFAYVKSATNNWELAEIITMPTSGTGATDTGLGYWMTLSNDSLLMTGDLNLFTHRLTAKTPGSRQIAATYQESINPIFKIQGSGPWALVETQDSSNPEPKSIIYHLDPNKPVKDMWSRVGELVHKDGITLSGIGEGATPDRATFVTKVTSSSMGMDQTKLRVYEVTKSAGIPAVAQIERPLISNTIPGPAQTIAVYGVHLFVGDSSFGQIDHFQIRPHLKQIDSKSFYKDPINGNNTGEVLIADRDGLLAASTDINSGQNRDYVHYFDLPLAPPLEIFSPQSNGKIDTNGVISGMAPPNTMVSIQVGTDNKMVRSNAEGRWKIALNEFGTLTGRQDIKAEITSPQLSITVPVDVVPNHSPIQLTTFSHEAITALANNMLKGECQKPGPLTIEVVNSGETKTYNTECVANKWLFTLPQAPKDGLSRVYIQERDNVNDAISLAFTIDQTPPTLTNLDFAMTPVQVMDAKPTFNSKCEDNTRCVKVTAKLGDGTPQEVVLDAMGEFTITVEKDLVVNMSFPIEVVAEDAAGNTTTKSFDIILAEPNGPMIIFPEDKASYDEDSLTAFEFSLDPNQPTTVTLSVITPGAEPRVLGTKILMGAAQWTDFQLDDEPQIYELVAITGAQEARVVFSGFEGIDEFTVDGQTVQSESTVDVPTSFEISGTSPCVDCEVKGYWLDANNQLNDSGVETETDSDGNWTLSFENEADAISVDLVIQIEAKIGEDEYVLEDGILTLNIGDGMVCDTPPCDGMMPGPAPEKLDNALCAATPTKRPPALPMMLVLCIILGYVLSSKQNRE